MKQLHLGYLLNKVWQVKAVKLKVKAGRLAEDAGSHMLKEVHGHKVFVWWLWPQVVPLTRSLFELSMVSEVPNGIVTWLGAISNDMLSGASLKWVPAYESVGRWKMFSHRSLVYCKWYISFTLRNNSSSSARSAWVGVSSSVALEEFRQEASGSWLYLFVIGRTKKR